ncbi:restriction endonuclease [Planomicrobium chinense]|uniref:restriction endonuclease n=1 Tax=Planococcus chinensis TaxID=272917 RepID=UPI001CC4EE7D|nr:restriction endonuclease [Planococcus chinensis]MBZ5201990.1 restriction endonuclease [Planococcus chinensis]
MAIPGFQEFMYPFLEVLKDGKEHSLKEVYGRLAEEFKLSNEEKEELLLSGKQRVLHNRIGWTRTYLNKAGLLKTVRRGIYVISDEGRNLLNNPNINRIDNAFLMKYEDFREFKNVNNNQQIPSDLTNLEDITPLEEIERNYKILKEEAKSDLLDKVKSGTSLFFEKLVVELLVAMGYGGSIKDAGQAVGRSGDEGIDGVIKEDILGLDMIYLQAKRWENTVTRPELQKFVGSLYGQQAGKGVFITTSSFSEGAKEYVRKIDKKVILIDGSDLAEYMFEYNIGVGREETFVIKKVNEEYFEEE